MDPAVYDRHIEEFSNYLFQPDAEWALFDVGDYVRFRKQVGLISNSVVYRIVEARFYDAHNFRIWLEHRDAPMRIPLIIDRCDVSFAKMCHL